MKGYLIMLGVAIIAISLVGGSLYLSSSFDTYQARLHALGAQPGAPITLYDVIKWQFAEVLGGGIIFGGLILGSMLMGLGWIAKTLEQIRDALAHELDEVAPRELFPTAKNSKT